MPWRGLRVCGVGRRDDGIGSFPGLENDVGLTGERDDARMGILRCGRKCIWMSSRAAALGIYSPSTACPFDSAKICQGKYKVSEMPQANCILPPSHSHYIWMGQSRLNHRLCVNGSA